MLRAEDVGYFDPDFKPSEQEHGNTTPSPVVNAGKHAYYLDVFVFVDHLNELKRKYGPERMQDFISSCLRGTAQIRTALLKQVLRRVLLNRMLKRMAQNASISTKDPATTKARNAARSPGGIW